MEEIIQKVVESPLYLAIIIGIIGQVFGTQRVKFLLSADLSDRKRKIYILMISTAFCFPTYPIYVVGHWLMSGFSWAPLWHGLWIWFAVWAAGTAAYEVYVRTRPREVQDALSARIDAEERRKVIRTARGLKAVREDYPTDHDSGEVTVIPAGTPSDHTVFDPGSIATPDDEDKTEPPEGRSEQ